MNVVDRVAMRLADTLMESDLARAIVAVEAVLEHFTLLAAKGTAVYDRAMMELIENLEK